MNFNINFNSIKWKNLGLFFLCWLALLLFYAPADKAGFYADFTGLFYSYEHDSFSEFINRSSSNYQIRSFYQVTQLLYWILISVLGKHPAPWYVLFTLLHTCAGMTVFLFFKELCAYWNLKQDRFVSLTGLLMFLFGPIAIETVVWKACFHYFNAVIGIFLILRWLLLYMKTENKNYVTRSLVLYFISVFTLELFYLTPVFVFIIIIYALVQGKIDNTVARKSLLLFWLGLCVIWGLYLLGYHMVYHQWVAHRADREDVRDSFAPLHMGYLWSHYLKRIVGMDYWWPDEIRKVTENVLKTKIWQVIFVLLSVLGAVRGWVKRRKWSSASQLCYLIIMLGAFSTIVIVPYWINEDMPYFNDRYFYLLWCFIAFGISLCLHAVWYGRYLWLKGVIWSAYFGAGLIYGGMEMTRIQYSADIFWGLIRNFKWDQKGQTVYILNAPLIYKGYPILPLNTEGDMENYIATYHGKCDSKIYVVASYNLISRKDKVMVTKVGNNAWQVSLMQWGNWWWNFYLGASNYETPKYIFTDNIAALDGVAYKVQWKDSLMPGRDVIIYQGGPEWKEVAVYSHH